jgi:glutaminase
MGKQLDLDVAAGPNFISTGLLPPAELVRRLMAEAHARFGSVRDDVSTVYPALAEVSGDRFAICVVGTNGNGYGAGETDRPFASCEMLGSEEARSRLGVNATGLSFNSTTAMEYSKDARTNPMVNRSAIAATGLVRGETSEHCWRFIEDGLSAFAGRRLALNEKVYASAAQTNIRTQGIARLLESYGRIYLDPLEATDRYTRQRCMDVTARDPAVMATAGPYETSVDWRYEIGLPGKSGIVARFVSEQLGLSLFASRPADEQA